MLTLVEQGMKVQLFSHIATWETSQAWGTCPEKPHRPASHSLQGTKPKRLFWTNAGAALGFCLCEFRVTAHAGAANFQRQLILPEGFALKTRESSGTAPTGGKSAQLMLASETQM